MLGRSASRGTDGRVRNPSTRELKPADAGTAAIGCVITAVVKSVVGDVLAGYQVGTARISACIYHT